MKEAYFECNIPIINQTEKAICFERFQPYINEVNPCCIPKSQIKEVEGVIYVKKWMFEKLTGMQKIKVNINELVMLEP